MVDGEIESYYRITSVGICLNESRRVGRSKICVAMPREGVACCFVVNARITIKHRE